MRWLITGGAGFIGSHLSDLLLQGGDEVDVLDDLSTGSARNVEPFRTNKRFRFFVDSVTNIPLLSELVDSADVVVHLAAAVGVKLIVESPVRTIETNIRGTEVVLHAANKKKKRVLVASTSEVYGKSLEIPFREEQDLVLGNSTKGRWSYAASKLIDEFLALAYWKEKKLPTTVVRLFNTVGPRQTGQYGMVVPTFVRQALSGRAITVYGNGEQSRCFGHVADIADAIRKLTLCDTAVGEVFNLGSNEEVTIRQLAVRVKEAMQSSSPIEFIPYEKAYEAGFEDMMRRIPDTTKAAKHIGFAPKRTLDDILRDVIAHEKTT